jgi:hypothetical protein
LRKGYLSFILTCEYLHFCIMVWPTDTEASYILYAYIEHATNVEFRALPSLTRFSMLLHIPIHIFIRLYTEQMHVFCRLWA